MKINELTKINAGDLFADDDLDLAQKLVGTLTPEDIVAIAYYITDLEQQLSSNLPEAATIVWTEMFDQSTGQKYNLTSRSAMGDLAWRNLKHLEQTTIHEGCAPMRPTRAAMSSPGAVQTAMVLSPENQAETSGAPTAAVPSSQSGLPTDPNDPYWKDEQYKKAARGRAWGLVTRKPKASDLGFGDTYSVQVDEFEFNGSKIDFFKAGIDFPFVSHNMTRKVSKEIFENIFPGWKPPQGARTRLANPLVLHITCSDENRKTTAGNPYQNLSGAEPVLGVDDPPF